MEYMKICFRCNEKKPLSEFYVHKCMKDGHLNKCKSCTKLDVQHNYLKNITHYRSYDQRRQRDNIKRILDHRYAGIKRRVTGSSGRKYRVLGSEMLSREQWNQWNSLSSVKNQFITLYITWKDSGFKKNLMPSIDRIRNSEGYVLGNIQWLSKRDNNIKFTNAK